MSTEYQYYMEKMRPRKSTRKVFKPCNNCIHGKIFHQLYEDHQVLEYCCGISKALECKPQSNAIYKNVSLYRILEETNFIEEKEMKI